MSEKNRKNRKGDAARDKTEEQPEGFFNPFRGLDRQLKKGPDYKKPAAGPESSKKPSAGILHGNAGKTPPRRTRASDEADAALFLAAMRGVEQPPKFFPGAAPDLPQDEVEQPPEFFPGAAPDLPQELSPDEADLFAKAVAGARPMEGKGRDLAPEREDKRVLPPENPAAAFDNLPHDNVIFALEYTDEFFEGRVMGLDPLVVAKLRAGQYSLERHIDLHGLNAGQAHEALVDFIRVCYNQDRRSLVVVTGRGKNSPGGMPVLRANMESWLTREPLKRVVLAFCTAQPKDGGPGALYVLLRKFRKKGKIRWDRGPWEDSALL